MKLQNLMFGLSCISLSEIEISTPAAAVLN